LTTITWAVEGDFWHCWKAQFPAAGAAPAEKKTTDTDVLRERLLRALRKRHGEAVEVKESFRQDEDKVVFALLVKRKSTARWDELCVVERPRLKTARLAGYDAALKLATVAPSNKSAGASQLS